MGMKLIRHDACRQRGTEIIYLNACRMGLNGNYFLLIKWEELNLSQIVADALIIRGFRNALYFLLEPLELTCPAECGEFPVPSVFPLGCLRLDHPAHSGIVLRGLEKSPFLSTEFADLPFFEV